MKLAKKWAVAVALMGITSLAQATPLYTDAGFGAGDGWVTFDDAFAAGTAITNQYADVTFGGTGVFNFAGNPGGYSGNPNFGGGYLDNFTGVLAVGGETYEISFANVVNAAGAWWEFNISSPAALFTALLDGVEVDSFSYDNDSCCSSTAFLGFSGVNFDTIRVSNITGTHFIVDNLHYSAVPEPAALSLLLLGAFGLLRRRR